MQKRLYTSKICTVLLAILFVPQFVNAQEVPRLEVTFDPDPLFSENNLLPGDGVSGTITVTNNSGEAQTVITEAINVSDPDLLSDQMTLTITEGASTFFSETDGSFFDFLTAGPLTLTDPLPGGGSITYTYTVDLADTTGDPFQGSTLGFDLCIGFQDLVSGMDCGGTVVGDPNITGEENVNTLLEAEGGGGTGIIDLVELQIFNERVVSVDDSAGSAVIAWDTNLFSTSQVVYGLASGGPYSLSLEATNYGYPFTTIQDSHKVMSHQVTITGLIPGEVYSYRVVSTASPPTVSYEHDFVVLAHSGHDTEHPITISPQIPSPQGTDTSAFTNPSLGDDLTRTLPDTNNDGQESNDENTDEREDDRIIERLDPNQLIEQVRSSVGANNKPVDETEADAVIDHTDQDDGVVTDGTDQVAGAFLFGQFGAQFACVDYLIYVLIVIGLLQLILQAAVGKDFMSRIVRTLWISGLIAGALLMILFAKWCTVALLLIFLLAILGWSRLFGEKEASSSHSEHLV